MSSDYQQLDLLAKLNTLPPYTAAVPPTTTRATAVSAEDEASLQKELDWWQSVEFGIPSLPGSRKSSTTSELAGKPGNQPNPHQQLQDRLRQESTAVEPANVMLSRNPADVLLTRPNPTPQLPVSATQPATAPADLATGAGALNTLLALSGGLADPTALTSFLQQQQQQQQQAAQALLSTALTQSNPLGLFSSLHMLNNGLFGALAGAATAQQQPESVPTDIPASPPTFSIPSPVALPISSPPSPQLSSVSVTARVGSSKRRSPSPIRPAPPSKRHSPDPTLASSGLAMLKNGLTPDEDKRRRNTAASARFRQKKKMREMQLEQSARDMAGRVDELEERLHELEQENRWLRSLVIEKDPMLLGEGDGKRARLVEVDAQASAGGGAFDAREGYGA